ncbi:MAG: hypothetical protein ACRDSS_15060, partial [Actinocrinis sp.]
MSGNERQRSQGRYTRRGSRPRQAIVFGVASVVASAFLAGCASSGTHPPVGLPSTEPYSATYTDAPVSDCPANATDPAVAELRQAKPRTPLPSDFQPVAAIRCVNTPRTDSSGVTYRDNEVQRASGNLSTLLTRLREPDEVMGAGQAVACPALGQIVPVLGLVGPDGTVIRPRFPIGICGLVRPDVQSAVNALAWKAETRTETKVTPVPGALAKNEPGCPQTTQFLLEWPQSGTPEPWSRVRHPPMPPTVLICVYAVQNTNTPEPVGALLGGLKLTPAQGRAVDQALAEASTGAYPVPRCG